MTEQWKPISGYEDTYEVSNLGRVRSLERTVKFGNVSRTLPSQIIKPYEHTGGYLSVKLAKQRRKTSWYLHRLVAAAFIGPGEAGQEVRHWNGDKQCNVSTNLLWGTRLQNMADRDRLGEKAFGTRHGMAKLSEEQVLAILRDTRLQRLIAADYGISSEMVSRIKAGKAWRHLR